MVYSRYLAEFTKGEMCLNLKDVVGIHIPKRDNDNKIIGPLIIELEFERHNRPTFKNWRRKHQTTN